MLVSLLICWTFNNWVLVFVLLDSVEVTVLNSFFQPQTNIFFNLPHSACSVLQRPCSPKLLRYCQQPLQLLFFRIIFVSPQIFQHIAQRGHFGCSLNLLEQLLESRVVL